MYTRAQFPVSIKNIKMPRNKYRILLRDIKDNLIKMEPDVMYMDRKIYYHIDMFSLLSIQAFNINQSELYKLFWGFWRDWG